MCKVSFYQHSVGLKEAPHKHMWHSVANVLKAKIFGNQLFCKNNKGENINNYLLENEDVRDTIIEEEPLQGKIDKTPTKVV